MKKIDGTEIESVNVHYENVTITVADPTVTGGFKSYFISKEQLLIILNEFSFNVRKKRTREWLTLNIEDWRVERFDQPRGY